MCSNRLCYRIHVMVFYPMVARRRRGVVWSDVLFCGSIELLLNQ